MSPAINATLKAFEAFIAIFFTFAAAAYWIFERDKAVKLSIARPDQHRKIVRDTWTSSTSSSAPSSAAS